MTTKRKLILAITSVLAAALILIVGIYAWTTNQSPSYSVHIKSAEKLVADHNYEAAELAYQDMIDQDPDREEGYIGLANVYSLEGKTDSAVSTIRSGILRTGSAQLTILLTKFAGNDSNASYVSNDSQDSFVFNEVPPVLDEQILSVIGAYTYNDYRVRYGIDSSAKEEDGSVQVRPTGLSFTLLFKNTTQMPDAVDSITGEVRSAAIPVSAAMDDFETLFGGSNNITVDNLISLGLTDAALSTSDEHGSVITFTKDGCLVSAEADDSGRINMQGWSSIQPVSVTGISTGSSAKTYLLKGKVISATTGKGVGKATVNFRRGSLTNGNPYCTVETSSDGTYEASLENETYTAEVECSGYTAENFKVHVGNNSVNRADDFVISPTVEEGAIRIVLTWDAEPSDLDSYLTGNLDDGTRVSTNYMDQVCTDGSGNTLAELDVDDRSGYGPETTTIYNSAGVLYFKVHDYLQTDNMPAGSVTVKVYLPGQSPTEITICDGVVNDWNVLKIDHGVLQVINEPD